MRDCPKSAPFKLCDGVFPYMVNLRFSALGSLPVLCALGVYNSKPNICPSYNAVTVTRFCLSFEAHYVFCFSPLHFGVLLSV